MKKRISCYFNGSLIGHVQLKNYDAHPKNVLRWHDMIYCIDVEIRFSSGCSAIWNFRYAKASVTFINKLEKCRDICFRNTNLRRSEQELKIQSPLGNIYKIRNGFAIRRMKLIKFGNLIIPSEASQAWRFPFCWPPRSNMEDAAQ
jgi:hypothetical protein